MLRLHPILILIGFRLRANAPEGQKRFPISFLTTFALSAGLVLFPARAKAAYVATELAVLTEATIRVVTSSEWLHRSGRRCPARQWSYPGVPVGWPCSADW